LPSPAPHQLRVCGGTPIRTALRLRPFCACAVGRESTPGLADGTRPVRSAFAAPVSAFPSPCTSTALPAPCPPSPVSVPTQRPHPLVRRLPALVHPILAKSASALTSHPELASVRELENCPHFNAGRGSVLTTDGTVEMEACIMDGNSMKCGAVSGLSTVVNAISLARLVMEKTPHIYLAFDGAEAFAREQVGAIFNFHLLVLDNVLCQVMKETSQTTCIYKNIFLTFGVEIIDASHFITPENVERLKQAKQAKRVQIDYTQPVKGDSEDTKEATSVENGDSQIGTVGCVAVDGLGNLAAATSTGGLVNKMVGRIGDTPIIGAGTYANSLCAISATGKGESIIRGTVARDVAAVMEYRGLSLKDAAAHVVARVPKGDAGLVAVSASGEVTMAFNTTGMFRACATEDGYSEVGIWP
ncbi:hypothetical protein Taro_034382, partial [Colocasia esculenta]|nr:hypothetical protein [Colocasia esculenta]